MGNIRGIYAIPFTLILLSACSPGFKIAAVEVSELSSLTSDDEPWPKVVCPVNGSQKIQVAQELIAPQGRFPDELKNSWIESGEKLLVTVKNQCHLENSQPGLFSRNLNQLTPQAEMTTFSYRVSSRALGETLYQEMLNDECVIEIDRDVQFSVSNVPPTDPLYANQRYLASVNHSQAFAGAFNQFNGINQEIRVAIIDSGVDVNHPDLINQFATQNGMILGLNGMQPGSRDFSDSGYHGTHVAGLMAAQANNSVGMSGVAGLNIKLMPVKASDDGVSISASAVTNGIRWAADNGAKVINLSLGGETRLQAWLDAIRYANQRGALVVVAAGNDGRMLSAQTPTYPAMFSTEASGVLTVGSFDATSVTRSSFSNFSPQFVNLFAPGSDGVNGILSTVPTNLLASGFASRASGQPIQGTSMAAPLVSGAAALVAGLAQSRGFSITPEQIKRFFDQGSVTNANFMNLGQSGKILDIKRLVDSVASDTGLALNSAAPRNQAAGRVEIQSASASVGLPSGESQTLNVQLGANSSILVSYQWLKNDQEISGETNAQLNLNNVVPDDTGVYRVRVSSGLTQRLSRPIKVAVEDCN